MAFYSWLHEFGHGLYEAQMAPAHYRTTLADAAGLGVHESQSRLWENLVGRSRPFCEWVLPLLRRHLDGFDAVDPSALYRDVNQVRLSLIRIEADETTYNLHIALRLRARAGADRGPAGGRGRAGRVGRGHGAPARPAGARRGPRRAPGHPLGLGDDRLLPDLHAREPDGRAALDGAQRGAAGLESDIAAGDFGPLREWLREHIHRHGRKFESRELLRRATGEELSVEPLLTYLETKLLDAGLLTAPVLDSRS